MSIKIQNNQLTLLEEINERNERKDKLGIYICTCGTVKVFPISLIASNKRKTCGCSQHKMDVKEGSRFGLLSVIKELPEKTYKHNGSFRKHRNFLCKCDCGNYAELVLSTLRSSNTRSCGCLRKDATRRRVEKHGMSKTDLYKRWKGMNNRCYNENVPSFADYGGRGIGVCAEWRKNFMPFYEWAITNGYKKELQLDRINNDGNYEPINCRWANNKTQSNNRRSNKLFIYNNELKTLSQICNNEGVDYKKIYNRIYRLNIPFEEAISKTYKKRTRWETKQF